MGHWITFTFSYVLHFQLCLVTWMVLRLFFFSFGMICVNSVSCIDQWQLSIIYSLVCLFWRLQVHQHIGYCPQFDALIDLLTGRETLFMFCRLRGIAEHQIAKTIDRLTNELLLRPHIDCIVETYRLNSSCSLTKLWLLEANCHRI